MFCKLFLAFAAALYAPTCGTNSPGQVSTLNDIDKAHGNVTGGSSDIKENKLTFYTELMSKLSSIEASITKIRHDTQPVRDCLDIYQSGRRKNGIYRIWPKGWKFIGSFYVYCDMETEGGGWTVIQRRGNYFLPNDYFDKPWDAYRDGFGQLDKEFWLGNDKLACLTNQKETQLLIKMSDRSNSTVFAKYDIFLVSPRALLYKLEIGGYSGNAGNAFGDHSNSYFSTVEKDNIRKGDCTNVLRNSGWWHKDCSPADLNGIRNSSIHLGLRWTYWKTDGNDIVTTEMKLRPLHD